MKHFIFTFAFIATFVICSAQSKNYRDVSADFSPQIFEALRTFVLQNGDRQTFRILDVANPHFSFKGFEVYLGGVHNRRTQSMNNKISEQEYYEIIFRELGSKTQYQHFFFFKEPVKNHFFVNEKFRENRVYFRKTDNEKYDKSRLIAFLKTIKETMRNRELSN